MTDKRLTQSPRALRDSTEDAEKFAKGSVPASFARDVGKAPAAENEGAYKVWDEKEPDRASGWPPAV